MKKKFLFLFSVFVITIITLFGCANKEEESFLDAYLEYAIKTNVLSTDNEIKYIRIYKDKIGGKLASLTVLKETDYGAKVEQDYYLVINDIVFDSKEIELQSYQEDLYASSIKQFDGTKIDKGYLCRNISIFDDEYTLDTSEEYNALITWKQLQAEFDDVEFDLELINKKIKNYNS